MGGRFEICFKSSFTSIIFFIHKEIDPYNFLKFKLDPEFYFPNFQFFFCGRKEKESPDSGVEKESCCW